MRPAARGADDRGQATVELAVAMPFVVVLALGVLQVGVVARDRVAIEFVAREAARAASVSADPSAAAAAAAHRVTSLSPLEVSVDVGGDTVRVEVRYENDTEVAMIGAVIADVELTAAATMSYDPP